MGGFLVEAAPRGRLQWTRERLCSRHAKALCAPKSRKIAPNRGAERATCPRRRCTTRTVCAAEDRRAKTADEVSWGPPHWASFGVAPTSLTTDFLDLGSEVDISAPEPGTTVSPDQMDEAFADGMGDQDLWLDEDTSPGGADAVLETVDGPRSRWAIEEDLSEFGQHLGFTGDPYELDDAALVAAYDDASAEMARQPRLATRYGPLSRVEVVVSLRWSPLSMFDELDETDEDVARLTDAELVQRIDRYFDEVLASGDVPDDPARLRTLLTLWGDHEPDDELMAAIVEHQMRAIEDLDLGKPGLDEDGGMFDPFTGCPPLDDGARSTTTTFGG